MKILMVKQAGGLLAPQSDIESEKLKRFKNNEVYEIDIKLTRNPAFLRKAFLFFRFCFEHWCADIEAYEYLYEDAQFETFRKQLTVLAGFKVVTYKIGGGFRVDAESLAFGSMTEDRFSQCYNALINAAMFHIFSGTDEAIYNKLHSFF